MPELLPTAPFFLIVTDHNRGVFSVEGPMTVERPVAQWSGAVTVDRAGVSYPGILGSRFVTAKSGRSGPTPRSGPRLPPFCCARSAWR